MAIKLLIADDNKTERLFFRRLAERIGTEPHFAESGADCLKAVKRERFDLIFIDYLMPETDGIQTLKEIRKDPGLNPDVPVIALGSPDKADDDEFFIKEGFVNYIEKPVDFNVLRAALMLYLPDKKKESVSLSESPEPKAAEPEENGGELAWLTDVKEISIAAGVKNCGSMEGYISALNIFYNSIDEKADEIMHFYEAENWLDYTIKVHALKSSARIIGAQVLSDEAFELEMAGNNGKLDLIRAKTQAVIEEFRGFKKKLAPLGGEEDDDSDKPLAEPEFLEDAYSSLVDFAGQMDFDLVEMVLESVKDYRLEDKDKKIFAEIDKKFSELDWHGIGAAAAKGLE